MDWAKIDEKFDDSLVKKRKGAFGQVSYVGLGEYIKRLNEIFDYQWDFEIVADQILEGFVVVQGKLIACGVTKMQYGNSRLTVSTRTNTMTQVGDDFKAAASDCLKKCASCFGIGLALYEAEEKVVDNSGVLQSIAKGEEMILAVSGGALEALRDNLFPDRPATGLEEAATDALDEYYTKLLKEYDTLTTLENTNGEDA